MKQVEFRGNVTAFSSQGQSKLSVTIGTFSIDNDSENVTFKMNWCFFQLCRVYSNSLKISNVGKFPWS